MLTIFSDFSFFGLIGFGVHYIGLSASYCIFRLSQKVLCMRVCVLRLRGTYNFLLLLDFINFLSAVFIFVFFGLDRFRPILYQLGGLTIIHFTSVLRVRWTY